MASLTNALQALGARAKQTVMRQPNAVKALLLGVLGDVVGRPEERQRLALEVEHLRPVVTGIIVTAKGARRRRDQKGGSTGLIDGWALGQGASEEGLLGHRLRCISGINARRAQKEEFFRSHLMCRMNNVTFNHQVVVEELCRPG